MNVFWLIFQDEFFESKYKAQIYADEKITLKRNVICLEILAIGSIFYFLFKQQYEAFTALFIETILIGLGYYISIRSVNYLDYFTFALQLFVNSILPITNYVNYEDKVKDKSSESYYYMLGQTMSYFSLSLLQGSRFQLKAFSIIFNLLFNILLQVLSQDKSQTDQLLSYILFILSGLMYIARIYKYDFTRRTNLVKETGQIQWQNGIDNAFDLSVIQCSYNATQNEIIANKVNKSAQQRFLLGQNNQQQKFKTLIRDIIIYRSTEISSLQIIDQENFWGSDYSKQQYYKKHQLTLEIFLFYMFTDPLKCIKIANIDERKLYEKEISLICLYKKKKIKITLIVSYDNAPIITLMLDKTFHEKQKIIQSKSYMKIKELLDYQIEINNQHLRKCLVQIQKILLKFSNLQNNKILVSGLMQNLYIAFNTHLNVQLMTRWKSLETISTFSIISCIDEAKTALKNEQIKRNIDINIGKLTQLDIIKGRIMLTQQLIFNCLELFLKNTQNDQKILIIVSEKKKKIFTHNIIKIQIQNEYCTLDEQEKYFMNNNIKQYNSHVVIQFIKKLIGVLGPTSNFKYNGFFMKFSIFQSLEGIPNNSLLKNYSEI